MLAVSGRGQRRWRKASARVIAGEMVAGAEVGEEAGLGVPVAQFPEQVERLPVVDDGAGGVTRLRCGAGEARQRVGLVGSGAEFLVQPKGGLQQSEGPAVVAQAAVVPDRTRY
jgi:hypothetical protein